MNQKSIIKLTGKQTGYKWYRAEAKLTGYSQEVSKATQYDGQGWLKEIDNITKSWIGNYYFVQPVAVDLFPAQEEGLKDYEIIEPPTWNHDDSINVTIKVGPHYVELIVKPNGQTITIR